MSSSKILQDMLNDSQESLTKAQEQIIQQEMFPETLVKSVLDSPKRVITEAELQVLKNKLGDFQFKTDPYNHQLECFIISRDLEVYALFMEMGTGKSKVIVDTIAYLWQQRKISGVLIFGNKGSYRNWVSKEIPTHMPSWVDYFATYWDAGAKGELLASYEKLYEKNDPQKLKIFVMNIESLSYDRGVAAAVAFARHFVIMMAVDESTTIKNRNASRTKNAVKLGTWAEYRRILTGSPITKQPMDLFSQCEFLDWKCLGFSSFEAFQGRYADLMLKDGGRSAGGKKKKYYQVVGYRHLDELSKRLKTFSYRVRKEECLDLPPKIYETVQVELTDEQVRMYKELVKRSETEIEEGVIASAPMIITRLLRLHQLVCGHLTDEEGNSHEVPSNRLTALMDLLEETDGKVIIWATYRRDVEAIAARVRKEYGDDSIATYYGATSSDDRDLALRRFADDPVLRFIVGNPSVGGYGTTMVAASTVVYYSNNYNLEVRLQSEDRAHRIGQDKSVTYIDLITPGTVDEKIVLSLLEKKGVASKILGDPFNFRDWIKTDAF